MGYTAHMNITHPPQTTKLTNRFRRLEGQLQQLRTAIESEAACDTVIPQFLAVKGALNAAFTTYVQHSIRECAEQDQVRLAQLIELMIKRT